MFRKLLTLVAGICLSLATYNAYAQSAQVSLSMQDVSLEQVMKEVERQTGYLLVYHENIDLQQTVSVNIQNVSVTEALNRICSGRNVSYRLSGSNISLYPMEDRNLASRLVRGCVTDVAGQPVIGASVMLEGTTNGGITDIDGNYQIEISGTSAMFKVECLGYEPVQVEVGDRTVVNVTMTETSLALEGTVVTALGIRRSEKALNYNVQQVDNSAITTVKDANFINSLNGKIAGVTINASSSGVGGESKVVMRGTKGISQSSNALYVIDGVPMYTMAVNGSTDYG